MKNTQLSILPLDFRDLLCYARQTKSYNIYSYKIMHPCSIQFNKLFNLNISTLVLLNTQLQV